ncbi:hypothetical protein, partial [Diaphorobacter caeni]|uniref:hypothetical protein n=1 Tax=Diaphorobacter caeni TaxID=2784387 RepID=UPI00188DF294
CNRLREIAFEGAEPDGGPRYVLAQNASAGADKPLWLFFSVARMGGSHRPTTLQRFLVIS